MGQIHLVRKSPHRDSKRSRKSKICQLQIVPTIDQQILWLQIAVQDPVGVAVKQTGVELVRKFLFWLKSGSADRHVCEENENATRRVN